MLSEIFVVGGENKMSAFYLQQTGVLPCKHIGRLHVANMTSTVPLNYVAIGLLSQSTRISEQLACNQIIGNKCLA